MLKLALFDLDHTLLPIDSDYAWGEFTTRIGWTDPVDFQALTPGRHWQTTSPREAVDGFVLGVWFGPGDTIEELRSVTCGRVADRHSVTYRLGVRRGGRLHAVEQHAYFDVDDAGRVPWIRIVCSGYRPDAGAA